MATPPATSRMPASYASLPLEIRSYILRLALEIEETDAAKLYLAVHRNRNYGSNEKTGLQQYNLDIDRTPGYDYSASPPLPCSNNNASAALDAAQKLSLISRQFHNEVRAEFSRLVPVQIAIDESPTFGWGRFCIRFSYGRDIAPEFIVPGMRKLTIRLRTKYYRMTIGTPVGELVFDRDGKLKACQWTVSHQDYLSRFDSLLHDVESFTPRIGMGFAPLAPGMATLSRKWQDDLNNPILIEKRAKSGARAARKLEKQTKEVFGTDSVTHEKLEELLNTVSLVNSKVTKEGCLHGKIIHEPVDQGDMD